MANIKKTIYYLKRNGIRNTWYAVLERLEERKDSPYTYQPVSEEELARQREWSASRDAVFSILVPTYRTNETYLREMILSVAEQSYPHWELILADATPDDSVRVAVEKLLAEQGMCLTADTQLAEQELSLAEQGMNLAGAAVNCGQERKTGAAADAAAGKKWYAPWGGGRLCYVKLTENAGIAANTNQALKYATGDYVGLLDHDDVLTLDALYEMAYAIEQAKEQAVDLQMIYSDEDKCNGDMTLFYEPNKKEDFNQDLLYSNNYICHFLVMTKELIQSLGFRPAYDGAQDYDLVLRASASVRKEQIGHVSKVLYHWRCHTGSTAENPQSKQYAYDAGLRALQDLADRLGYEAKAVHLKHLGFYKLVYEKGALEHRPKLGAVGGRVLGATKLLRADARQKCNACGVGCGLVTIGGRMSSQGIVYYEGLPKYFSGKLHRAVLTQSAEAVDIRCIQVRKECRGLFEEIVGIPYLEKGGIFDASSLSADTDYVAVSLRFGQALQEAGYGILYDPERTALWK